MQRTTGGTAHALQDVIVVGARGRNVEEKAKAAEDAV